ncbi:hypothetical protein V4F39_17215 [Aquincola sp. MAHUQ-54]|uniref:Uncharacterized protein n=1 Tax=Aquincola agrisoli TaxID=3119538 RepID=A0AAW9Q6M2_9BURK
MSLVFRPCLRLCAAAALTAMVSACGGGGGEGSGSDGEPNASTVFAAPSGALCATKDDRGHCLQPTASAVTAEQMLAVLNDPEGPQVKFEGVGQVLGTVSRSVGTAIQHFQRTYDLARKTVVIGRQRVEIDGKVYRFTEFDGERTYKYVNDANTGGVELVLFTEEVLAITESTGTGSTTGSVPHLVVEADTTVWVGEIGLLTDRADAVTGDAVRYQGVVFAIGGPGTPLPEGNGGQYLNGTSNGCDITLEFNPVTGVLRAEPTSCVGSGAQFTLADDPVFENSEPKLKSAARSTGVVIGHAFSDPDDPTVSATFGATKFDGAFFGRGAKRLHLSGSDANGSFYIKAERQ